MKLELRLRSFVLNFLMNRHVQSARRSISEVKRKLGGGKHVVSVFVELDDPYSYLLCHYLPELEAGYDIELRFYLTEAITGALRPAPELYPEYAALDCERVARELGIPFLDKGASPVVEHRQALQNALAARVDQEDFAEELMAAITAYWRGDSELVSGMAEGSAGDAQAMLEENQRLLEKLGHYNTAMIHYGGEWFWGVDRLHYLVARLQDLGVSRGSGTPPKIAAIKQAMKVDLPVRPPSAARELPPLELFYSFRSPYSWLMLRRAIDIADAFGLELHMRPVLPMVMRGMQVPKTKILYIAADSVREAARNSVPFGKIADPVGTGVERCLAVLNYAHGEKRERDFMLAAGEAIWSEAVDVSTDAGLRRVTARAGLFWPEASAALKDESWRPIVEDNRQAMMDAGSWGVPTLRIGDFTTWGQDRDWLLVRHIEELCDTGDGILV